MSDLRQRFYIEDSPVRGEVVHLEETLQTILAQRDYAPAVQVLLGEMLSATALLASTLKIKGRISLQIQASGSFKWAMAECNHLGEVRALADYEADPRFNAADSSSTPLLRQSVSRVSTSPSLPMTPRMIARSSSDHSVRSATIITEPTLLSRPNRMGKKPHST